MKLNRVSLKDKKIFRQYLNLTEHELSVYAFQNIYIWRGLFDIYWAIIGNNLCIFFKDKMGCFLYLPPQGNKVNPAVIGKAFMVMDEFNKNKDISRIENIEQKDMPDYRNLGYAIIDKSSDYLCKRADLAQLKGNRFKSKRACFNYFMKNYRFEYLPFALKYRDSCLRLYNLWMTERKTKNKDALYQGMLRDSRICLKILLEDYSDLGFTGRLVRIGGEVKAFSFGFKINPDTFCILYEITDLSIQGLAQFIFRQFCSELKDYRYINIMDDSGLENLKKVKLSYSPVRLIPSYIIKRKDA